MRDYILEPDSMAAERVLPFVPTVAASVVAKPFASHRLSHQALVKRLSVYSRDVTGVVSVQAVLSKGNGLFSTPTLAIDSTPEDFQLSTAFSGRVGSATFYKAATTGISFTLAHVINATLFGVILIQITPAGVVSSKVPIATQVYTTAALALAALPTADAGNVPIGYIAIEADAGNWTANTDDMTDASDVTTATFNSSALATTDPLLGVDVLAASPAFVDGTIVQAAMAVDVPSRIGEIDDLVVLMVTGDGSAALADAHVELVTRPFPLKGEVYSS